MRKFFSELRRRNFCKVGVVYVATAWLFWQIMSLLVEYVAALDWTMMIFQIVVMLGFPAVMTAAWLLELTPDGFRLQKNIEPGKSIARKTGRQLTRGIVMILSMALVLYVTDRFREQVWPETSENNTGPKTTSQVCVHEHTPDVTDPCVMIRKAV